LNDKYDDEYDEDPYLDADMEILRAFEEETGILLNEGRDDDGLVQESGDSASLTTTSEGKQAVLVISNNGTMETDFNTSTTYEDLPSSFTAAATASGASSSLAASFDGRQEQEYIIQDPSDDEVEDAQKTIRVVRDYLPQLVSIALKSPPAFDPRLVNPVDKLRQVIVRRCVDDANWGVDMCWLLEAEVGRAWKTLFEHRQQTGRRLIVVLPAEKAAVLAKIGSGKREAFDLLQDAEQATAFGYTVPMDDDLFHHGPHYYQQYNHHQSHRHGCDSARLPSSLSLRRCSHFGDTMHFIDRLTRISLDLRQIPAIHRHSYLQENLNEMNRRLRRRMVTRGDVSLDVEDHRGPSDWPHVLDITVDMLRYSVHLPVDPKVRSSLRFCIW
jgi:hypothetical protein